MEYIVTQYIISNFHVHLKQFLIKFILKVKKINYTYAHAVVW